MANVSKPPVNQGKQALIAFAAVAVILGVSAGAKQTFGGAPGERCGDAFECKWGAMCISNWCYRSCKTNADCGSEQHCGKTDVTVEIQGTLTREEKDDTEQICFANRKK